MEDFNREKFSDIMKDLRYQRGKKKLSLKELASDIEEKTGASVSESSLRQYESGKKSPGAENLFTLAKYYNVSTDFLLGLHDRPSLDIEEQAITKKTGLTASSVKNLISFNQSKKRLEKYSIKAINTLIESETDFQILLQIYRFLGELSHFDELTNLGFGSSNIESFSTYHEETHSKIDIPYKHLSNIFLVHIQNQLTELRKSKKKEGANNASKN